MTATIAKDGLAFVTLANLASGGLIANRTADSFRAEAPEASFVSKLNAAVKWLAELPRRRAVLDELSSLSDHELADVGLTRGELDRVFDRQFTAQRASLNG